MRISAHATSDDHDLAWKFVLAFMWLSFCLSIAMVTGIYAGFEQTRKLRLLGSCKLETW